MSCHTGFNGHNRAAANGGPKGVHRNYASNLRETEGLFLSYEHLHGLPRADDALLLLRKVASQVKPIMRKRGWKVQVLAEFLPNEQNLLGLNINRGYKICIRLRYHNNTDLFLPIDQIIDTMLHELTHIIWGDHDRNFHQLWDELRDECETLMFKGYTGEGFLSEGRRLGGSHNIPNPHEMRRLARFNAEKRKRESSLTKGSGQRLGGAPLHRGKDVRDIITAQATRRNMPTNSCGSGRKDAVQLGDNSGQSFKTKAEEDDANNRAIAQALYELMESEEERKLNGINGDVTDGLAWDPKYGLYNPRMGKPLPDPPSPLSEEEQLEWALKASMQEPPKRPALVSPVSPLTPSRTISAPVVPTLSKPQPNLTHRPKDATTKPLSRLAKDNEAEAPSRKRVSHAPSISSVSSAGRSTNTNDSSSTTTPVIDLSEPFDPTQWACAVCTCLNPVKFLACDACGSERPQQKSKISRAKTVHTTTPRWEWKPSAADESLGWNCHGCGSFMEHKWWTCSVCGQMKTSS